MQKTTLAAVATAAALILIVGIATTGQTRWIIPLGVVLLAAAIAFLIALPRTTSETPRKRDERGITLQTLIVTAVLVLMAGAAGVVIIAITNNANDNLENQNAGIESRCEKWEIFDPTLDAAGRGGEAVSPGRPGLGGITSSAIGCRRVCYVQQKTVNTDITATNTLDDSATADSDDKTLKLLMSRSSLVNEATGVKAKTASAGEIKVVTEDRAAGTDTNLVADNHRIEVATNQRYCRVWDDSTDEEVASLRSE